MLRTCTFVALAGVWLAAIPECMSVEPTPGTYFVALNGNDAWSGTLPEPNAARTDGPFLTLDRARDAVRAADRNLGRAVVLRGGTYYLTAPLRLGPEDSGTAQHPVVYQAYPGETVRLSGGRPITGWQDKGNGVWAAPVPEAKVGGWEIRQLRVGDAMQTLARHPNRDPQNPTTGGWLFARMKNPTDAGWYLTVESIHNAGDWMEWDVDVSVAGEYALWLCYGQDMKPFGRESMDGQTVFQVDAGADVPLSNLPNTGSWQKFTWTKTATLSLPQGRHVLRWTNRKGGGINFNAFALCTDPAWTPKDIDLPQPAAGSQLLVVQAEQHARAEGKEMRVGAVTPPGHTSELPFGDGDIPDGDLTGAQVMVFPAWGWVGGPVQVGGVDRDKCILKLTGANATQEIRLGNRYCLENVRGALDQPGEFYLDRAAGELLYMPTAADFAQAEVVAPVLDRLVEVHGDPAADTWPEHIRFRGLAFSDSTYSLAVRSMYEPDDAAIWFDQARDCVVEDCTFAQLGGYAVHLRNRTTRCQVLGCSIFDMGQGGVIATGKTADQATDCVVAGCLMHHLGRVYKHVSGVYITTGSGHRVANCTMTDLPRYGISFKTYNKDACSHNNVAEYNEILRSNLETNDTGAIETLGRDSEPSGNIIRYNLILDVVGMKDSPEGKILTPHYTWGIYLDDYSSGTQINGNVVARTVRGGYHNHLGFDNIVENNIFIDGQDYQGEYNGNEKMRRNVFRRNIVVFGDPKAVYLSSGGWAPEVLAECDRNVVWHRTEDLATTERKITPVGNWAEWQKLGFDTNSVVADPKFVNAAADDYRLQPDSPALALGFEPIPFEKIGVKGYTPGK
ncbi:MAG: hypothetical protein A3K19_14365 [Lentisphaerae bacterium RIFOXYB12_FULL_65_16]|nr:MAG: hypothetical protein A3K18_18410 [Lentisphaerae bacterium RIFOXYA12_64_32]OGV87407.1 MAG: hypothetical protein A3K19_14365 [Lentisphaerae bacterium RIFOXYB12_FULL_65_16]